MRDLFAKCWISLFQIRIKLLVQGSTISVWLTTFALWPLLAHVYNLSDQFNRTIVKKETFWLMWTLCETLNYFRFMKCLDENQLNVFRLIINVYRDEKWYRGSKLMGIWTGWRKLMKLCEEWQISWILMRKMVTKNKNTPNSEKECIVLWWLYTDWWDY